jgi:hypothetical protein
VLESALDRAETRLPELILQAILVWPEPSLVAFRRKPSQPEQPAAERRERQRPENTR